IILWLLSAGILFFQGCFIIPYIFEQPVTGDWDKQSSDQPFFDSNLLFGQKKLKKKLLSPPISFMDALREYRIRMNSFPLTMRDFQNYSAKARAATESLKERGYVKLKIDYWSLDSFRLAWKHPYVEGAPVTKEYPNVSASGVFIFTYKDSSFETGGILK